MQMRITGKVRTVLARQALKAQLPVASPTLVLPGTSQRLYAPHPIGLRKAKYISEAGYFHASSSDFT
ncbi:hypothetical protein ACA29_22220 [Lederbergia galactosidilytica]|uniref:Uncharacterized protein n=1 Tax=Lederbergia galactosidilytica TaxID=217031 RepID=A0A0Q9Y1Z3_9BACI|nr:hypothetical protein ACA29_22220 [Lederbergia galactosidilytica]